MATGKPRFYWDTAPLIAWIADEKRAASEMSGLAEVVEMVDRGHAILMTSVLWRAEVLDLKLSTVQRKRLEAVFDDQTIVELSADSRVMDLASELRSFQKATKKKDALKNLRVPDAIHLASAILYEATEFHTFDGARAGPNAGGLLTMDGNVGGHKLKICVPSATQLKLDLAQRDDESGPLE